MGFSAVPTVGARAFAPEPCSAERPRHAIGQRLATLCQSIRWREIALQAGVLLVVAVLIRITRIGDPALGVDEQFYLLVGDRIWQGAVPFVDIWDRKPIGLFLLYAAVRPLSADGVVAYQLAALVFAASTALVLARIALRITGLVPATIVGALYLIYLPLLGGGGGQSPVFYNLFTALAALLVVRAIDGGREGGGLWPSGLAAMLLVGLAIQIKYMAVFEGMAFGVTLLWLHWRTERSLARLAGYGSSLVALALLPTMLVLCVYALSGHAGAFVSANFLSIFKKSEPPEFSEIQAFLEPSALRMAFISLLASVGVVRALLRSSFSPTLNFVLLWSLFTFLEFFAIGHYYEHYALPLLMPMVVIVGNAFWRTSLSVLITALMIPLTILTSGILVTARFAKDKSDVAALTHVLAPYARKGCIYVYDGPSILYLTTHSCLPTPYAFPSHLADANEAGATDAHASLTALLRSRPSAVVTADRPKNHPRNADTDAMLAVALTTDYHLAKILPDVPPRNTLIYVRKDLR